MKSHKINCLSLCLVLIYAGFVVAAALAIAALT